MDNYIQKGDSFRYSNSGSAIDAGDVVTACGLVGVAVNDIAASGEGEVALEGVFSIPKATGAIAVGNKVYWDADGNPVGGTSGAGAATTTSTSNTYAGYCVEAAESGDSTVKVKLNSLGA